MGKTQVLRENVVGSGNVVSEMAGMWGARVKAGNTGLCPSRQSLAGDGKDFGIYPKPMRAMGLETGMI